MNAYDTVLSYHQTTKHRFEAYARGPETLDWDEQPAPFRRYADAPSTALPLTAAQFEAPFDVLHAPERRAPAAAGPGTLGALLELSFAVSAWKSNGVDRWAVRSNPSSGNLHPTEAYLLCCGINGLADGVHHYRPDDHALELRAAWEPSTRQPALLLGLSSVIWRETWKYGERSFRYCQLDLGHAVACLAYAAALLGWRLREVSGISHEELGALLGLDRAADFRSGRNAWTEREEPELLLAVELDPARPAQSLPTARDLNHLARSARWHGTASSIDPRPMYRWTILDDITLATRRGSAAEPRRGANPVVPALPPARPDAPGAVATILGRRSGQRYDGRTLMRSADFFRLLDATLDRPELAPWQTLDDTADIALLLFVHRVEGLTPGLYLLPRDEASAHTLPARLKPEFANARRIDAPAHLDLRLLAEVSPATLHRLARSICCHQDIASMACFTVAMLAEFAPVIERDPERYRELFRHAGLIGQVLYLEAEAIGYRGTGIGCYFDDALHELIGLQDTQWQSLYHFAVGMPVLDSRIETTPPYPERLAAP